MQSTTLLLLVAAGAAGVLPAQAAGAGSAAAGVSEDEALPPDDECLPGGEGEEQCAVNLLASRVRKAAASGTKKEEAVVSSAPARQQTHAETTRHSCQCPPGFLQCLAGAAIGGCFPHPAGVPKEDCSAFDSKPCNPGPGPEPSSPSSPVTSAPAPPSPASTVVPLPAPLPAAEVKFGGPQTTRLRVTNGCLTESMWIAHMVGGGMGVDPQNVRLPSLASYDFTITDGLSATRYWPKLGCNERGEECAVGDSGGPGQTCNREKGCSPPVDSKFEATFGVEGEGCQGGGGITGCDWLDISLVDGFTLPFFVKVSGDCGGLREVDCSQLQLDNCPEDLVVHNPFSGQPSGCYSPCAKLTYPHWDNQEGKYTPWDEAAQLMCCPTPPVSPEQCSSGPVASSSYVEMVHSACPGVYGYAYDDAQGLSLCTAGTQYEVTFYCPADEA